MKHKSETMGIFKTFKSLIELQLNHEIKSLHSDIGWEFTMLLPFLTQHGINTRFSCPYTHQQNGILERKHRHITETGLTLLSHAKLPMT